MIALKAIPMNQEESAKRQEQDERYRGSQDDISIIRKELNKLTGAVGEMVDCLKGNEFGQEGLVKQARELKIAFDTMNARVTNLENAEKFREKAWRIVFLLMGTILGSLMKSFFDRLVPIKK